eukprot:6132832-Amphidinium_carterae.1
METLKSQLFGLTNTLHVLTSVQLFVCKIGLPLCQCLHSALVCSAKLSCSADPLQSPMAILEVAGDPIRRVTVVAGAPKNGSGPLVLCVR